jgi:16S rRNA A1518/A1519 N6-dimethyltransferase RsmA/KsgA/DIM1 with predicted DNA glycosylase/AP lyase activity
MLENQFYPTPKSIIAKMISASKISRYNAKYPILDPSAGSGAILDYLREEYNLKYREVFAIEIDPDLVFTLQGKDYPVLGTNFLEYNEPMKFGTILMNPPFKEGDKHVLKAWELLDDEGTLVALINSETLNNPCSQSRKNLVSLIELYGETEDLGQCFKYSERPTDVNATLVKMTKPKSPHKFTFDGDFEIDSEINFEEYNPNNLAHRDTIKTLVARYNASVEILKERHYQQEKLDFYLEGISREIMSSSEDCLKEKSSFNTQLSALKSRFWNTIFSQTKIGEVTTSQFQQKFYEYQRTQVAMAFTVENIHSILSLFYLNSSQIMLECCEQVFDKATAYHEKNIIHTEGWKTNKSYRVNKRIILPYGVSFNYGHFSYNYYTDDFLKDLDKVLCWLSGLKIENIKTTSEALHDFIRKANQEGYQQSFESSFFKMRIFKKGTLHLDFLDMDLLDDFNLMAAQGKKWIGEDVVRKKRQQRPKQTQLMIA